MTILQTVRVALRALFRNKTRSTLTALGIVIGVAAVIAMVAIGEGAKDRVQKSFSSMGANLFIVMSGSSRGGGAMGGAGSMPTITWDDLNAIRTEIPSVRYAAATLRTNAQVMSEEQNWLTQVYGTSPDFFEIREWSVQHGEPMSESDVAGSAKVAFIGQTVSEQLFGKDNVPLGRLVRIRNVPFIVRGILAKKGQSAMGQDNDDAIYVPQTTFQSRLQGTGMSRFIAGSITVSAIDENSVPRAIHQVTALLRDRHRLRGDMENDFSIRNLTEMANAMEENASTLTTLLAAIAAVSLLVGGIGIMNIMLVSVTERTREIGIRMAVGARRRDILAQFLVEALTLSFFGGLIGIALGVGIATELASRFGWSLLIRADVILLAVGFSAVIGIVFGLYPARRASLLDPIDALRYE